jgi:hypothetical protein
VRIHPRQRILDVWRSVLSASFQNGIWVWGGQDESNSISDAEQLLCLLYPATEIVSLCLDRPDVIAGDVLKTLRPLGDSVRIPRIIIGVLGDYIDRHTNGEGEPVFAGGSYFRNSYHSDGNASKRPEITKEQLALDIVDSYSMSVTLCLAALGFIKVFKPLTERRPELKADVEGLERTVSKRLTAAMVGLLRSFVVNTVEIDESSGRVMLGMVNQAGAPEPVVLEDLRRSLARVRASLRDDVRIGVASEAGLGNDNLLFECGWTWSIAHNAAPVDFVEKEIARRPGIADSRPYLYFTAWRSTASTTSILRGLVNWACSTRSSGASLTLCKFAGTSRSDTGRPSPASETSDGRWRIFPGGLRMVRSQTTTVCWSRRFSCRTCLIGRRPMTTLTGPSRCSRSWLAAAGSLAG